ncbi:MAG: hypothetical protein IPG07_18165 [Crocinitomicaceae bacterium]|nr:hypothetical protein [Crocinitomicaceae bacterium]
MSYYLSVTDANGCVERDTISIDTLLVVLGKRGPDAFLCYNDSLTISGSSNMPLSYNLYLV